MQHNEWGKKEEENLLYAVSACLSNAGLYNESGCETMRRQSGISEGKRVGKEEKVCLAMKDKQSLCLGEKRMQMNGKCFYINSDKSGKGGNETRAISYLHTRHSFVFTLVSSDKCLTYANFFLFVNHHSVHLRFGVTFKTMTMCLKSNFLISLRSLA